MYACIWECATNVNFYFIKYKLLSHLRIGDPIYCLPKKKKGTISKHSIISHGTIWNASVSSLPYIDRTPWVLIPHGYLFLAVWEQCPAGQAALPTSPGSPARAPLWPIHGCCDATGCRAAAVLQAAAVLSSLPSLLPPPSSTPATTRPLNEQGDKCLLFMLWQMSCWDL